MKGNLRIYAAIAAAGILAAFAAIYYFFDPSQAGWMPRCLWRMTTGTDCPGCGSQRMAHALMHGDLQGAWQANAFALCMLPVIAFLIWMEFARHRHPALYRKVHSPILILAMGISILLWWIMRNLI